MELRNKSPFYPLFTPIMMSNRQLPIYIYFHLILSIKLSLWIKLFQSYKYNNFATLNNFTYNILDVNYYCKSVIYIDVYILNNNYSLTTILVLFIGLILILIINIYNFLNSRISRNNF